MLKGLTVQYLFRQTYRLQGSETILFHAAAGGVGLIACQWAQALGVKLIGTVGSAAKAKLAKSHGAWEVINYSTENFVERVVALTGGAKVPVVYDGVGKDTWEGSLDCLQPRGLMVSYGSASGPVTGVSLSILAQKGSLYVTRPTLATYVLSAQRLQESAAELFGLVGGGQIRVAIEQRYALADVAKAHADLAARRTSGSCVLVP
jgi:NADPH2:quinone reductase